MEALVTASQRLIKQRVNKPLFRPERDGQGHQLEKLSTAAEAQKMVQMIHRNNITDEEGGLNIDGEEILTNLPIQNLIDHVGRFQSSVYSDVGGNQQVVDNIMHFADKWQAGTAETVDTAGNTITVDKLPGYNTEKKREKADSIRKWIGLMQGIANGTIKKDGGNVAQTTSSNQASRKTPSLRDKPKHREKK